MKSLYAVKTLVGLAVLALLLGAAAWQKPAAADSLAGLELLNLRSEQAAGNPLTGSYTGQVTFQGVYTGVFSDTQAVQAFEGGSIDLALDLEQAGAQVDGYISLDHTLVFTQEHSVSGAAVGPWVRGSYEHLGLALTSEKFNWQLASGRVLPEDGRILPDRQATRQFRLVTIEVTNAGARLVGEYRETFWGLSPRPITLVGTFILRRPAFATTNKAYLPELFK